MKNIEFNVEEKSIVRQRNPEELTDQELYGASVIRSVFVTKYGDQLSKIPGEAQRNLAISKKLNVFADALRRGHPNLLKRLESSGVSLDSRNALVEKTYRYDEEGHLSWKIGAKSRDPFARMDFLRRANKDGIELAGIVADIYTEEDLVNLVFEEGRREQGRFYTDFKGTVELINEVGRTAQGVLPRVTNTKSIHFLKIMEINDSLQVVADIEREDEFISRYVSINHLVLDRLAGASEAARSILGLRSLFRKRLISSPSLKDEQLAQLENSLVVELLTNPEGIKGIDLGQPKTTVEKISRLYQALSSIPQPEYKEVIFLVVQKAIEAQSAQIASLFQAKKINPDIGLEYLQNLAYDFLNHLPVRENLSTYFNLPIPVQKQEREPARRVSRFAGTEINAFARAYLDHSQFSANVFRNFNSEERDQVLKRILTQAKESSGLKYKSVLESLIHYFGIRYEEPEEIIFDSVDGLKSSWVINGQAKIVNYCLEAVSVNDQAVIEILGHELVSETIKRNLRTKVSLAKGQRRFFDRISIFGQDREQAIREAVINAALYGLNEKYLSGRFDHRANLADPIDRVINSAYRVFAESVRKKLVDYDPRLPGIVDICHQALSYAEAIVEEIKKENLPLDFEQNKQQYMQEALKKALNPSV